MIGARLSHFRILSKIGEGGMGVVYKAEDERLRRPVALKVLPTHLVNDPDRRHRFVREARAAAAVTHPNIATVHEIDEADGVVFIAMEFVEGRTLRALIGGRPMPIGEALRLGVEIAEGLASAHQAKVIHRDLKPENVMVTTDGRAKILDFGLAKTLEGHDAVEGGSPSELPTISREITGTGKILGTPMYMSPEQAAGRDVDPRSDVFSFGVVLHEMVTGRRPLEGMSSADTARNPRETPKGLGRILSRCLEVQPSDRYQDGRDLVVDLRRLALDAGVPAPIRSEAALVDLTARSRSPGRRGRGIPLFIGGVLLVGIVAALIFAWERFSAPPDGGREPMARALTANSDDDPIADAAISPDGKYLAYTEGNGLIVRLIEGGEIMQLPFRGAGDVSHVSWYPDGTRLLVSSRTREVGPSIWSVSVLTGEARKLREGAESGSVSPDGARIAFASVVPRDWRREIWVMGEDGREPRRVAAPSEERVIFEFFWSPDGRRVGYEQLDPASQETSIESVDLRDGSTAVHLKVPGGPQTACWASDGRLLFARAEPPPNHLTANLWELPLDPSAGKPSGEPRRITRLADFTFAHLTASSSGKRLSFLRHHIQLDVYVGALEENGTRLSAPRRLTLDDRDDTPSDWSLDGRSVVFTSNRNGTADIFVQKTDSRTADALVSSTGEERDGMLSPDGAWLLYWTRSTPGAPAGDDPWRLVRAPPAGGSSEVVFTAPPGSRAAFDCGRRPAAPCVLSVEEGESTVLHGLDPLEGKQGVVGRIERGDTRWWRWSLSPDGTMVAFVAEGSAGARIEVLSLKDGTTRELPLDGWRIGFPPEARWSAAGEGLFVPGVSTGVAKGQAALLRIDLDGTRHVVWSPEAGGGPSNPVPSRDGRSLAFQIQAQNRNVWMLEGF